MANFFPKINQPPVNRIVAAPDEAEITPAAAAVAAESKPNFFIPTPPPIQFSITPVLVPATTGQVDFVLPWDMDWVAVYFPSAPAATLTFGPEEAVLPMLVAGFVIFPFTTTRIYRFKNSGAAYTAYVLYGRGVPPPSITAI